MKNYEEMAKDVFDRIDEYNIAKRRKQKAIVRTSSTLACLCLVVAIAWFFVKNADKK